MEDHLTFPGANSPRASARARFECKMCSCAQTHHLAFQICCSWQELDGKIQERLLGLSASETLPAETSVPVFRSLDSCLVRYLLRIIYSLAKSKIRTCGSETQLDCHVGGD